MAVVMELGCEGWRSRGKEFVVQMHHSSHSHSSSSSKSGDSSSTSGASPEVLAMAAAMPGKKRGWGQDLHKAVQLMLGQVQVPETLDLLGISNARNAHNQLPHEPQPQQQQQQAEFLELDPNWSVPEGWEKCLDLRSGAVYFQNRSTGAKTYVDPRQQQRPGLATPSSRDGDPGGSDSAPTTPVNFLVGTKPASSSPSPRPTDGSSSGLCLGSCLSAAEMTAPAPWALEHWAAAAKGFSERIPQQELLRFGNPGHVQRQGLDNSGLDLKLSSCTAEPRFLKDDGKSVCTMEKVREALLRDRRPPPSPSLPLPQQQQGAGALPWSKSQQPLLNLRSPPASPSDSSSSASSSTPPSDCPAPSAGRRKRGTGSRPGSPKNVAAASCCLRAGSPSGPNCVSSSSNVSSSPNHPSSGSICPVDSSSNLASSSTHISPNLASLKLSSPLLGGGSPFRAAMESSDGHHQDLGLGLASGATRSPPAVTLKCCKNCLIYVMLSKAEVQCPRCHNSGLLDFSSTAPGTSSLLPANKKPKLEVVEL